MPGPIDDPHLESIHRPASIGCLGVPLVLLLFCLIPLFLIDVMQTAMLRLHLSPPMAMLAVFGIFVGSVVNVPLYRIAREDEQFVDLAAVLGLWGRDWLPRMRRVRRETIIAVNLGGCVIPVVLASWQVLHLASDHGWPLVAAGLVTVTNSAVCYFVARPVEGVGIAMPGLVSPLVAVGMTWLLLGVGSGEPFRAPVAFVGGVLGPLIGADVFHLKEVTRISAGMLSIGGAGTFDGIVLSGVLAAVLA